MVTKNLLSKLLVLGLDKLVWFELEVKIAILWVSSVIHFLIVYDKFWSKALVKGYGLLWLIMCNGPFMLIY